MRQPVARTFELDEDHDCDLATCLRLGKGDARCVTRSATKAHHDLYFSVCRRCPVISGVMSLSLMRTWEPTALHDWVRGDPQPSPVSQHVRILLVIPEGRNSPETLCWKARSSTSIVSSGWAAWTRGLFASVLKLEAMYTTLAVVP